MLGWIALAVLIAAGVVVVLRLARSWGIAWRRYGGGRPPEPPPGGPADPPGPGPA